MRTASIASRWAALFALSLVVAANANAQTPNDQDNYYGDRLKISVNVRGTLRDEQTVACIPGGTSMQVVGQDETHLFVKLEAAKNGAPKDCDNNTALSLTSAYQLALTDLKRSGLARTGVTYGALVVPFKYHTSGDREYTGSASVGGYAGYRFETLRNLGFTATPIGFMGAANISLPSGSGNGTDNVMGFSYGVGLVATFKGSFQTGVVVGWDRVGNNANYKYNGKPWVALEIGYAFLQ